MAIDTIAPSLQVAVYHSLLETFDIPLTDSHFLPHRISGRDVTVCYVRIRLIALDNDMEGLEGCPSVIPTETHSELQAVIRCFFHQ